MALTAIKTPSIDGSASPELVLRALGQTKPIYKLERITYENDNEQEVTVFLMVRADVANTTPKVAALRVDVDASGGAQTGSGDIGFEVNQNSVPRILSGGSVPMAENAIPPAGYSVVVNHVGTTWSAEMRIEDSLLGGWDHAVRIMALVGRPNQIGGIEATWPVAAAAEIPSKWAVAYLGQPASSPNQKPVADAGADQVVHVPHQSPVSLYGDNSYNADENRLRYQWTQRTGPNVRLENAQTANPSFTVDPPDETTSLVFQLVVADQRLESDPDEIVVTLLPTPQATPPTFTFAVLLPIVGG